MIELNFQLPDPRRRLAAVRLAHELRDRLPHEFTRRGKAWELTAPAPDVARFEYQLELIDARGESHWIVDPANPKTASGPWGAKSVWEEPGYAPPQWVAAKPVGEAESLTIPSRILRADLPALKLAGYRKLADAHFQIDEYEAFCAEKLPHLDEALVEWIEGPDFDRLLVETVKATFPPHEHEQFVAHYRGLLAAWAKDQR